MNQLKQKVWFSKDLDEGFLEVVKEEVPFKDEPVAIKLHMGEFGNPNHLNAKDVRKIVKILKEKNCKPFLFDTTVAYPGERSTKEGYIKMAAMNGFTEESVECPIVIGDIKHEEVRGKIKYEVAKELCGVSVLVLTHVKGHCCSGMGGAIKNLGMGGVTKNTKKEIHEGSKPVYIGGCVICGTCVDNCHANAITLDETEGRPNFSDGCHGCSQCVLSCPQGALEPKASTLDFLLAESARATISKFKDIYYISILKNITDKCDCYNTPLKPVMGDIGVLASKDILAIEKASYDLIVKKAGRDIFKELNKKSLMEQVKFADELEMGNTQYYLERL